MEDEQSPKNQNEGLRGTDGYNVLGGTKNMSLVGPSSEVDVLLQDVPCRALIDTGSMISTISKSLVERLGLEIFPVKELIKVEGVGGHMVDYLGFVIAKLDLIDIEQEIEAMFLVMPDVGYNTKTPVLVGTNILKTVSSELSSLSHIAYPWSGIYNCLSAQVDPEVNIPVKLSKSLTVPANTAVFVDGMVHLPVFSGRMTVVTEEPKSALPGGLVISLCVLSLAQSSSRVTVEVKNFSNKSVSLPDKTVLCQLQQTEVVPPAEVEKNDGTWFDLFDWDEMAVRLTGLQMEKAKELVMNWMLAFSHHDLDMGRVVRTKHGVSLQDNVPFRIPYSRIPPSMFEEVRKHLQEMLALDAIRVSNSPYASPIVLVRKRNGKLRFCIDFRRLNSKTKRDAYTLPRIQEMFDSLAGAKWFSSLDIKSAYWQVEIEEADKEKTAFTVGPLGHYECNRMPFGLTNAPATFQRLMEQTMGDLNMQSCLIYLDDIVGFSRTFEEHLQRLEQVFQRLVDAGLKLSPEKCHLFQSQLKYLGHNISAEGVAADPEKIQCVRDWPLPKSVDEVQSFLGFVGYHRRFIKDFAKISRPLDDLLKGSGGGKKRSKVQKQRVFVWGDEQQRAFDTLVDACCNTPVLAFADYTKPFIVHTDASSHGLGAVLYQVQDGKQRAIAYASRGLSVSEKNYPVHKLEFLALKWAITEKFHDYLYGNEFVVKTDNNPVTYVLTSAKVDATGHHWVAELSNYNFSIEYRSGVQNRDADALSRIKWPLSLEQVVTRQVDSATCQSAVVESSAYESVSIESEFEIPDDYGFTCFNQEIDWRAEQNRDDDMRVVIDCLEKGKPWPHPSSRTVGLSALTREKERLCLRNAVLHRRCQMTHGLDEIRYQLVVPPNFRSQLIDFLSLERSRGGVENVLVVTDHFTRYAQAFPTKNQTARTTAKVLFDNYIVHYGFPARIHSDQGRNFESHVIKELCRMRGIEKSRTSPYHPMGNGVCERFNRTLISMLSTLDPEKKLDWKNYVSPLVHWYNCTRHDVTGFSPFYLMFCREPRLPIDMVLPERGREDDKQSYSAFVADLQKRLKYAHDVMTTRVEESQTKAKKRYDKRARGAVLQPGDKVLVRLVGLVGKQKLADKWEEPIYVVTTQPNADIPVYGIRRIDGVGRKRVLHRNMLLPVDSVPNQEITVPQDREAVGRTPAASVDPYDGDSSEFRSDDEVVSLPRPSTSILPVPPESLPETHLDTSLDLDEEEQSFREETCSRPEDNDSLPREPVTRRPYNLRSRNH